MAVARKVAKKSRREPVKDHAASKSSRRKLARTGGKVRTAHNPAQTVLTLVEAQAPTSAPRRGARPAQAPGAQPKGSRTVARVSGAPTRPAQKRGRAGAGRRGPAPRASRRREAPDAAASGAPASPPVEELTGPLPLGDEAILTAAQTPSREETPASAESPTPAESEPAPSRQSGAAMKQTAVQLGAKQRTISVSEFFTKNRHLLGFDNPAKALLTAVKEAVDNSLDACEEAGILPEIVIKVKQLAEDRFRVIAQDNGPGIVRPQIPKIFGSLLYGSKFHTLKQARGQQGLGISAAGMYGQLTTGKPIVITSRTGPGRPSNYYEIQIDTKRNAPTVISESQVDWDIPHGTRVEIELEATYKKGKHSVDGYLEQTALANPHASIVYYPPKEGPVRFERVSSELPKQPHAIKPHPHGVEFGILIRMLLESKARNLRAFMQGEFSRVSARVADEICAAAGLAPTTKPSRMKQDAAEALFKAISKVKIMSPPTNCLSPIGEELILRGLKQQVEAEFYAAVTRSPSVYRGNPFLIEAGIAYGGAGMAHDELVTMLRYANRVPLLYQQSACAITKSVVQTSWKNYGLAQSRGALPTGPALVMVHIASAWVPFTSESKEAIAHYPEIVKEIKLALQECGRKLGAHIRRRIRQADADKKQSYIEKYIPHIGIALKDILGLSDKQEHKVVETLKSTLERSRKL
jgi:DNA topoisomerase-6 subunit B